MDDRKAINVSRLSGSRCTYSGRASDASWRDTAADRIEKIRKAELGIKVMDTDGNPIKGADVHVKMLRHAFGFGSAVTAHMLSIEDEDGRKYREIVERLYNKVVFENDLKWEAWNRAKSSNDHDSKYRMEYLDKAMLWLNERDIEIRGHYISWAPLKEEQIQKYGPEPDKFRKALFSHIEEKVPKVGKRVGEWDAINHIVGWGTTLSTFLGGDQIYADIMKRSRELAPHAELWINEGWLLAGDKRREPYEEIIRYLMDKGAAPDGIGFMGHFTEDNLTPPEECYDVINRFAKLIPNLQLTELDVNVGDDEELQSDYLRDVMTMAFSNPAFQAIVMWGFWEGRHWKPDAALYRKDWYIKPAGEVWKDLVFNQWWTDENAQTDSNGVLKVRGFIGDYAVIVTHGTEKRTSELSLPCDGKDVSVKL